MSYQEKKTIVSLVTGVPVLVAYCIYTLLKYRAGGPEILDLSFWAISILVFIGIGIGIAIVTQIVFHIVIAAGGEIKRQISLELAKSIKQTVPNNTDYSAAEDIDCSEFENEDEMDKLIGLKTMRIGYVISGIGILAGIVMLAVKLPPPYMLHTLFIACGIGSLSEAIAQLYYYRKGI